MKFDNIIDFINENNMKRGWNDADLARETQYSRAMVSLIINGHIPSLRFCKRLARAYNEPLDKILIMAGLLEPKSEPPKTKAFNELVDISQRLEEDKLQNVVEFARFQLEKKARP